MSTIDDRIRPFLGNEVLKYISLGNSIKIISVAYFEKNFTLLATSEKPSLGLYAYYYQHIDNTDLVMCIQIKDNELVASLQPYQEIEQQLKVL